MVQSIPTVLSLFATLFFANPAAWGLTLEPIQVFSKLNSQTQTCVGYRTSKQVMLFGNQEVTGTTCSNIQVSRSGAATIEVKLTPAFESGNGKRDAHVQELLGGPDHTPVIMTVLVPDWKIPLEQEIILSGSLEILQQKNPVQLRVSPMNGGRLAVIVETKFSTLNLARPKVGPFGLAGSVQDDLTLFAQIPEIVIQNLPREISNGEQK